jgi:hypothetical protein
MMEASKALEPSKPSASKDAQRKAAAASAEEWEQWMEACRVGVRQPLGIDCRKRCYWALGGRASAWRIYVEDGSCGLWGWYEGNCSLCANAEAGIHTRPSQAAS